ncbi:MAG: CRTAC1 family protein [Actinomycetota bacterium]
MLFAVALLAVGAQGAQALGAGPQVVSLTISPTGASSVRLGEAFAFKITIDNPLPVSVTGAVSVGTVSPDGGPAHPADPWFGNVPARSSVTLLRSVTTAKWFPSPGLFHVVANGSFWLSQASMAGVIASPEANFDLVVSSARVPVPEFQDVTAAMGITTKMRTGGLCQDYAAGAAWGDVTGNGRLSLFVPQRNGPSELWVNEGGRFVERAAQYGVTNVNPDGTYSVGIGAVFVDTLNRGRPDLMVINDGVNKLYRNNGNGTFTDVATAAGIADNENHTSAAWGDFDGDGYLDVFVTAHGRRANCMDAFTYGHNHLYRNNGDGTFTDKTALLPHGGTGEGLGFQAAWFDYNHSGRPSLYLGNDVIAPYDQPNMLWRNDGPGAGGAWRFTDVSSLSGAGIASNTMGLAIGDYDRNGSLDVGLPNIGPIRLLQNDGSKFTNVAESAGLASAGEPRSAVWWGMGFYDFNNSGWESLYATQGELDTGGHPSPTYPNAMFVADGTGHFLDLSASSRANDPNASRGVAFADFDGDGRTDMFVVDQDGSPRLYRNVTANAGHWLDVRTVGTKSNRDGCGATVSAEWPGEKPMIREVLCGSTSLASGNDPAVHFGFAARTNVALLRITWPSGAVSTLTNVPADRRISVTEP